jgi:hypothetical protein
MKKQIKLLAITATLSLLAASANADPIELFDYSYNIDGALTEGAFGDPTPANVDDSAFDYFTGLGTIAIDVAGAGAHSVLAFFDHEINESINTYFNEFVTAANISEAGQTSEVDEPGFIFGDIYDNFVDNLLCNCNDLSDASVADDVSMAMGWDFTLGAGEAAVVSFFLSDTNDSGSAFNLTHHDLESGDKVYFWGSLDITPTGVPEPGTLMLFSLGLVGFGMAKKRKAAA